MLTYLPKPYPDELLYSVVARLRTHYRLPVSTVTRMCFGHKQPVAIDLPGSIDYFTKVSSALWGLTAEEIIHKFTLFPFYSNFIGAEKAAKVISELKANGKLNNNLKISSSRTSIKNPLFLRYCPQCARYDLDTYGETYWHRVHQLPGLNICAHHETSLLDSTIRYRPQSGTSFADATDSINVEEPVTLTPLTKISSTRLIEVAKYCESLLNAENDCLKLAVSTEAYRRAAFNSGFHLRIGTIDLTKLEHAFIEYYDNSILTAMGCNFKPGKLNWLQKIFRKYTLNATPISHVLVHIFLTDTSKKSEYAHNFGFGPWKCPNPYAKHKSDRPIEKITMIRIRDGIPVGSIHCTCGYHFTFRNLDKDDLSLPIESNVCQYGPTWTAKIDNLKKKGYSNNKIAKTMKVSIKVLKKILREDYESIKSSPKIDLDKIESNRREWIKLISCVPNGSKNLARKLNMSLYAKIYRTDRQWLISSPPASNSKNRYYFNWNKVDKSLVKEIRVAAKQLIKQVPLVQLTIGSIASAANRKYPLAASSILDKLPKCKKVLSGLVESLDDFRERRIRYSVQCLLSENLPLKRGMILRRAGLVSNNYSDRIAAVLEEVLTI